MPIVRVNAELQHDSLLPRDRTVNTFHVVAPDLLTATLNTIAQIFRDFFVVPPTGGTTALMNWLSTAVADTGHNIKIYDLGTPGSPPNHTEPFDFLGRVPAGGQNLPQEVAVCMSMRNESVTAFPARNRRGRIYFGPLSSSVSDQSSSTSPRPKNAFLVDLAQKGDELRTALEAPLVNSPLVVYSRVLAQSFPIERIHVDNEFDTVRSRGLRSTTRVWEPTAP